MVHRGEIVPDRQGPQTQEPVEQQRLYANLIPLHSHHLAQPLRCRANRKVPFSAHSRLHISSLSSGFEGRLCESNIDNCKPDPCHHGTCIDGIASYTCNCEPGYTGYRCENQLNECHSNPCQNGGKCVDLVNKYICQCQHGTSGEEWCINNSAVFVTLGFVCFILKKVFASHTGTNCEINFDDCASNPCDYGICKDGINRYECVCKPGFTGESGRDSPPPFLYKLE